MKTLWTFGDSFTERFSENYPWSNEYIKWKGYIPKVYGNFIAEKLNTKLINKAVGGSDNNTIFDSVCESIGQMKDNDIIIIGWSSISRFRLAQSNNKWKIFLPNYTNSTIKDFPTPVSQNTIDEIMLNRDSLLYLNELNLKIKLLNKTFKNNIIIHWSPFVNQINGVFIPTLNRIVTETNAELTDTHYSELGHLELADILLAKIESIDIPKLI